MEERNSMVILEEPEREIDDAELLPYPPNRCGGRENEYLIDENKRLHQDNEKLREIFRIATIEFEKKNREIGSLRGALKQTRSTIKMLVEENAELKERLEVAEGKVKLLNKLAFGKKSEKQEQEEELTGEHKKRGAVLGHKGRGRKIPEDLPVKNEMVDIPDEEKFCSICGLPYKETGMEEVSSEISVEKFYYVKRIKRKVYKKTCTCPHQIITAPIPGKIIPKGKFSISFWVEVLLNKYKNHMPIERQVNDMQEYGFPAGSGTIFNGLKKIYLLYLESLYQGLIKSVRESKHIHIDESGWKLFDMEIEEAKLLETIPLGNRKRITVDRFSSYKSLERLGLVEITYCWAHQRRDFIVAQTKYPELQEWADPWIEKIAQLYHSNNERIKHDPETESFKIYDKQVREIIDQMSSEINQQYSHLQQVSLMESMKKHWQGLTMFVDNPEVAMDNNASERMLRSPVLGRKNYWGNHSLWAGQLSAAMFSIIQTCISNDVSPKEYLTWYLTECVKTGSAPPEDKIDSFLPHNLTPDMRARLRVSKPGELIFPRC